jgi:hypothetical protein
VNGRKYALNNQDIPRMTHGRNQILIKKKNKRKKELTRGVRFDKIIKYSKRQVTNERKENKKTFQKVLTSQKSFGRIK